MSDIFSDCIESPSLAGGAGGEPRRARSRAYARPGNRPKNRTRPRHLGGSSSWISLGATEKPDESSHSHNAELVALEDRDGDGGECNSSRVGGV